MNVRKMMGIDRWVGVPACALVSAWRWLTSPFEQSASGPVRSIAFIKLAEQGSTVLAQTALLDAARRVGRENVYMVVFDDNRFIVDVLDVIPYENVITVRSSSLAALLPSAILALSRLRRLRLGAMIDLEFFARSSALLAFLSGAPRRVGFHAFFGEGPYRGNLMTHRVRYNPHLHTTQTFAMLVSALDIPVEDFPRCDLVPARPEDAPVCFTAQPGEVAEMERILTALTGEPAVPPIILLNANASDLLPLRRWDPERYVELARRLIVALPEAWIAFTGAREDAPVIDQLVARVNESRCVSLAGKTTLRQLMVVYTLADVLVTNDSGPAHFASLTPIRTVTLFGPETPLLFAALTPRNKPLWAGIACSPCVSAVNNRQSACTNNVCMQRISIEHVFETVLASYRESREQRPAAVHRTIRQERGGEVASGFKAGVSGR
jgi:ADP-heptose:LPS heptosyltransferase